MNIFFDFKYTGLSMRTTPISMSLLSDSGERFYAEFVDYDRTQIDTWTKKNIVSNLWSVTKTVNELGDFDFFHIGTKEQIVKELICWLNKFDDEIILVGDVCYFDMMLFINLFGSSLDLPGNISPSYIDVNDVIAKTKNINVREAFNVDRVYDAIGVYNDLLKRNAYSYVAIISWIYKNNTKENREG